MALYRGWLSNIGWPSILGGGLIRSMHCKHQEQIDNINAVDVQQKLFHLRSWEHEDNEWQDNKLQNAIDLIEVNNR